MKTSTSTLNPFAVAYVPLAKREVQDVDKECKTMPREAAVDDLKSKVHQTDVAHDTRAELPQEITASVLDEESEMDLAYLQMMFPGVSDQSLADVYNINQGDLEAAVDMLSELESGDDQPVASNVDNAREPISSGECSSVKAVSVARESCMPSGSPGVTAATS
ncbi:polyadenylate-binding protein-interacting protein 6-like [Silene latifolia]|uniref:polyadenylate-binding protein-interacting protein 6-like n=1 Tax=Silene latifolia TaxID=37657 RepID=UPI003D785A18